MKSSDRILIAAAAALGLGSGHVAASLVAQESARVSATANNGQQTSRKLEQDHFGGIGLSMMQSLARGCGCPPDVWGRSAACARMVRKNRLHRAGISHARI